MHLKFERDTKFGFEWHPFALQSLVTHAAQRYLQRGVYFVCVTLTDIPCLSAKHGDSSWGGSHFLDMFKMQMDAFEETQNKKRGGEKLPACLWEGGVRDNKKNIKYEEVFKHFVYFK